MAGHPGTRTLGLIAVALLLGACGTRPLTASHLSRTSRAQPTEQSSVDPHLAAARLDAAQLLVLAPVPPGAQPSTSAPPGVPAVSQPPATPGSPYLVDQAAWWTALGTMDSVMSWVRSHAPSGSTMAGSGSSWDRGVEEWEATGWSFPPDGQVVTYRQLSVMVAPDGSDAVAIRADGQVIWVPTRAIASLILPDDVRSVTVSQQMSEPWSPGTSTAPVPNVTVTDPSLVRDYVETVNGLPVDDVPYLNCPAWTGLRFEVTFNEGDGSVIATVTGDEARCGGYALTVDGHTQPALSDPDKSLLKLVSSTLDVPLSA